MEAQQQDAVMRIVTLYTPQPIPSRDWDWTALDDDTYDGSGSPLGHGATQAEAIEDLMLQLDDGGEDASAQADQG